MNLAAKHARILGLAAWAAGAAALGLLAAGCGDRGPTNLYSNSLFGQNQNGATLQLRRVQEFTLSNVTYTAGPDQYVIYLQNTGSGGVMGPITANVTMTPASPGPYMETYAGVTQTTQAVVFGYANQAIYPGDTVAGVASNESGPYQYSVQVAFPQSVSNTTDTFNLTATDTKGDRWTGSFSGTNY